jgi:hypothetical protein
MDARDGVGAVFTWAVRTAGAAAIGSFPPDVAALNPDLPASLFATAALFEFTKRCSAASYTIDDSRLRVTDRPPVFPERMVRETRAGDVEDASELEVKVSLGAFLTTDHFSVPAGIAVLAIVWPWTA